MPSSDELPPGEVIAGYRVLGVAGRGGMGIVYRALQLDLERPVALKLIATPLAQDEDFRERFVRESRAAAAIDHPNVIPVYSAGEDAGRLYLAMRFVEGEDLRGLVRGQGALAPDRSAVLIAQVAAALDAAHARGLVHRDVKPANVLLDGDHAYLTDFGLTKRVAGETTMTGAGRWVGTLGYIAPEQIRGEPVDARADVYALGCLLFFALTGAAPYRRDSDEATLYAHLHEAPPDARDITPDVPSPLADVVRRALAKAPADRFPSAGDLGHAALAAVGRGPAPGPERTVARGAAAPYAGDDDETAVPAPATPTELAPRVRRRPGWRQVLAPGIALVAGAATVGVTAALLSAGDGGSQPSGTADAPAAPVRGSARVAQNVDVDPRPNSLAYAQGRIWVTSPGNGRLIGLDAQGNRPRRTIKLPWSAGSRSVTAGFGSLWVTNGLDSILARIDPTSGAVRARIQLPRGEPVAAAAGGGSVWIARRGTPGTAPDSVLKIDPSADKVVTELVFGEEGVNNLAVGDGGVYVTNRRRDRLSRIDVRTGVRRSVPIGRQPRGVDVGGGFVWVANFDAGTATQLTPGLRNPYDVISGSGPAGVAVGRDTVWVTNQLDGTVARLDLRTGEQVGAPIPVGRNPYAIVARGASAWVTRLADAKVTRIDAG